MDWHFLAVQEIGLGEPGGNGQMKRSENQDSQVKDFLVALTLILSAGIILGVTPKGSPEASNHLAKKNLMGVQVGETGQSRTAWGKSDPEREWIRLFFEEP